MAKTKIKTPKPPKLSRKERIAAAKLEKAIAVQWGAPRKYDDPAEFDRACRTYFAMLGWDAPSVSGLCSHLGISRETFYQYKKRKEFGYTMSQVDNVLRKKWTNILSKAGRSAGAIFYISNKWPEMRVRGVGDSPENPMYTQQITGMRISKDKDEGAAGVAAKK